MMTTKMIADYLSTRRSRSQAHLSDAQGICEQFSIFLCLCIMKKKQLQTMSFLPMIMCLFFYIMIHTTGDLVLGSARPTLLTTCCQGWLHSLSHLLYASNIFHTLFYRLFYCHFLLFFCTHFFPLFLLLLNPHFLLFFTLFSFHFSQEKNRFKTERNPFQVKPAVGHDRKW